MLKSMKDIEGFKINYIIFKGSSLSDIIELKHSNKIIKINLDFKTHTTKQSNEKYLYPDQDYIPNQLDKTQIIRIGGFHMWDCVEKLAKRAYESGLDTLVDEDLTEFFTKRIKDPDFKIDKYPTYNPRKNKNISFDIFMKARKKKPWLWQNY